MIAVALWWVLCRSVAPGEEFDELPSEVTIWALPAANRELVSV